VFSLQMLSVTHTFEVVARLELPQIGDSIIDEIISELKCFPLQSRAAELPRYSAVEAWAWYLLRTRPPRLYSEPKTRTLNRLDLHLTQAAASGAKRTLC
jgi:hypothetical protein